MRCMLSVGGNYGSSENKNKKSVRISANRTFIDAICDSISGIMLVNALYNIVDQIFIGNSTLSYLGNAATGVSFPVICIANAFAWCVGDGAASYLSICAGRKDTETGKHQGTAPGTV